MELSSLRDTKKLSEKISNIVKLGDTILLYGEIGVGKTTFVRFFINHIETAKLELSEMGLMRLSFKNETVSSEYFMVRDAGIDF